MRYLPGFLVYYLRGMVMCVLLLIKTQGDLMTSPQVGCWVCKEFRERRCGYTVISKRLKSRGGLWAFLGMQSKGELSLSQHGACWLGQWVGQHQDSAPTQRKACCPGRSQGQREAASCKFSILWRIREAENKGTHDSYLWRNMELLCVASSAAPPSHAPQQAAQSSPSLFLSCYCLGERKSVTHKKGFL